MLGMGVIVGWARGGEIPAGTTCTCGMDVFHVGPPIASLLVGKKLGSMCFEFVGIVLSELCMYHTFCGMVATGLL